MIEAGKTFCPFCVRVHKDAYYSNEDCNWGVRLKRRWGKYEIETEDFGEDTIPDGKLSLIPFDSEDDTLPEMIQVKLSASDGEEELMLYRHCPICARKGQHREVNYILGKYPTFVIAMIGDRSAGKSAWLDAIATVGNTRAVNAAGYVHELDYATVAKKREKPGATKLESRGCSKILAIRDRQDGGRVVAVVYLVDVAGELYDTTRKTEGAGVSKKQLIWKLMNRNEDYPGADAYIFVESAVEKHGDDEYSADQIYADLKGPLLKGNPLAYVMTHLDQLIESDNFKKVRSQGDEMEYPVMTRDTFDLKKPTVYTKKELLSRVALEHAVVRAYEPMALDHTAGPMKCFLVRSCSIETVKKIGKDGVVMEELRENFSDSRNVMDPLIWILNQLKLFPLRERAK